MPGLGLLLLRAGAGITAIVQGEFYLADGGNSTLRAVAMGVLAAAGGVSLLIGFLTSVTGVIFGLGVPALAFSWLLAPDPNLFDTKLSTIMAVTVAAAVVLLGPGAYSLDARLFGRREIRIPLGSRPPKT